MAGGACPHSVQYTAVRARGMIDRKIATGSVGTWKEGAVDTADGQVARSLNP